MSDDGRVIGVVAYITPLIRAEAGPVVAARNLGVAAERARRMLGLTSLKLLTAPMTGL